MKKRTKRKYSLFLEFAVFCTAILLLFAFVMGRSFSTVFFRNTYEEELSQRTQAVAQKAEQCLKDPALLEAFLQKDVKACQSALSFLRDYATTDDIEIWLVAGDTVMASYNEKKDLLEFDEIPYRYGEMLSELFSGQSVGNQKYANVWNRDMFGVGAPVYDGENNVIAAVIVQVTNSRMLATTRSADTAVLLSTVVALFVALVLILALTGYFTRPLVKMKSAADAWVTGAYGTQTGVTRGDEIGQLASALDVLAERLAKLAREREESERVRYQFFADVSHELKTPVTVLRAQIEMLRDGIVTDPDEMQVCLSDALSETSQLQRLVEDLLTLAKLQSPEFSLNRESVCLCDVARDIFRSHGAVAAEKGVALVLDTRCKDKNDCTVTGDYTRIRQMVAIFVDNALKFTPTGKHIYLTIDHDDAPFVTVRDEGCGMAPEELLHAFDRFYTHYNRNSNGTGLGLPIAKQIADRHGAAIAAASEPGSGTSITVHFLPGNGSGNPPPEQNTP